MKPPTQRRTIRTVAVALSGIGFVLVLLMIASEARAFSPIPPEIRLGAADDGQDIEVAGGQAVVVTLDANPATGYRWEIENAPGLAADKRVVRQIETTRFESDSGQIGGPARQTLRFRAQTEGQDTVSLAYRRPWDMDPPTRRFTFRVRGKGPFSPESLAAELVADGLPVARPAEIGPLSAPGLPAGYNWCDLGKCTPIKDQGTCGSCWAFSTVAPLEANILIHDGVAKDLSEQYLLSANTEGWSCSGGGFAHNYHLSKKPPTEPDAGAVYEADLPYRARVVALDPPHAHHEKISSWGYVGNNWSVPSVAAIKQAIIDHGPVSAAVCVGTAFQGYRGGLFQTNDTCDGDVNHAIVLTGWDDSTGSWVLRNSWGPYWGENGYMRIKYGTSNVGFAANYVVYESTPDTGLPTGRLTSPTDSAVVSTNRTTLWAEAEDVGSGVARIEFYAYYDDAWQHLGDDDAAPYSVDWNCAAISDQVVSLAIDVVDQAGNRTEDAGGQIHVTLQRPLRGAPKTVYLPVVMRAASN